MGQREGNLWSELHLWLFRPLPCIHRTPTQILRFLVAVSAQERRGKCAHSACNVPHDKRNVSVTILTSRVSDKWYQ